VFVYPGDAAARQPELHDGDRSRLVDQILERLLEHEPNPFPVNLVKREETGRFTGL
jgi:hypothetical protein